MVLFYVFSGLVIFGSICSASELDNAVLKKLLKMESRLMQQETILVEQQTRLSEQQTELMQQKRLVVEQERRLMEQDIRITVEKQVNANQQRLIDQLQRSMKQQQQTISRLEMENNKQTDTVEHIDKQLAVLGSNRCEECNKEVITNSTEHQQHIRNVKPSLRVLVRRQYERVAFTAYIDHDLVHLGINHPIRYNQVLLNEGSGYHASTGIFICPMDGLYGFYFSIATYGVRQDVAKLVVEGVNQVDAISDSFHADHNAQGANFAVVSLRQGQQVWVASYHDADQTVHGKDILRFSTFSGFILY